MLSHRLKVHSPLLSRPKTFARGKVKGFSRHAASRLRNLLFSLDYPGIFSPAPCFGLALTCPPWVACSVEEVWRGVSKHQSQCPGLLGLVWRKEVTKKGVPHYHLIIWAKEGQTQKCLHWIVEAWASRLEKHVCPARLFILQPELWKTTKRLNDPRFVPQVVGQWLRYVHSSGKNLTYITSSTAVMYLCDHTSKHKAYQAQTTGRAWGVWNKDALPRVPLAGVDLDRVPCNVLARIQRALGKMSRYWYKSDKGLFGYRWSRARRFGSMGRHALFRPGAALAVRRLLEYYCPSLLRGSGEAEESTSALSPRGESRRAPAALPEPKRGGFTEFTPRAGNLQSKSGQKVAPGPGEDNAAPAPLLPGMDPSCITGPYCPQTMDNIFCQTSHIAPRKRPRRVPKWRLTMRASRGSIAGNPYNNG